MHLLPKREGFRLYLPAYLLMGPGIVLGYYFQSLGMAGQSLAVMLSRGIILPCIFAFVMPALFGVSGLWMDVPAAELVSSSLAIYLLRRSLRTRKKKSDHAKG